MAFFLSWINSPRCLEVVERAFNIDRGQFVRNFRLCRRAVRVGQSARQPESLLEQDARFAMRVPPAGPVRGNAQVLDRAWPVGTLFEVVGKIGRDVAQALAEEYLQRLSDTAMQLRAPARRLALIENLTVQGVHEFVTRGGVRACERLRGCHAHNAMPVRQSIAEVLEVFRRHAGGSGSDVDGERRAG